MGNAEALVSAGAIWVVVLAAIAAVSRAADHLRPPRAH